MKTITENEFLLLRGIDCSEFGDLITDPVWTWSATDCLPNPRGAGGIASSLNKKGLAISSCSGTEEACLEMTAEGVEVYLAECAKRGLEPHKAAPKKEAPATAGERLMPGCECGAATRGDFESCQCEDGDDRNSYKVSTPADSFAAGAHVTVKAKSEDEARSLATRWFSWAEDPRCRVEEVTQERQGSENAAQHTRDAQQAVKDLVMAARLARNVLDSYGLRGGALNALDAALSNMEEK